LKTASRYIGKELPALMEARQVEDADVIKAIHT
jgi:hypothetical protein